MIIFIDIDPVELQLFLLVLLFNDSEYKQNFSVA